MFARPFTWGDYHDNASFSLMKLYGKSFSAEGGRGAAKAISQNTRKLSLFENIRVYSNCK